MTEGQGVLLHVGLCATWLSHRGDDVHSPKEIIDVSPVEKFLELQESGQSLICLFPRRAECADLQ